MDRFNRRRRLPADTSPFLREARSQRQVPDFGVEPGEYDLAFRLYGSTEGCLVHPLGMAVVRVNVKEGQSTLDLGLIKVPAVPGLKAGDAAPALEFVDADGRKQSLGQWRGKYVLVDFWATWCGPCVSSISQVESMRQKYAERLGLIVVGANLIQIRSGQKIFSTSVNFRGRMRC